MSNQLEESDKGWTWATAEEDGEGATDVTNNCVGQRNRLKGKLVVGGGKEGEALGALMMRSLVRGLGGLAALLTQPRRGERTRSTVKVAGDGGSFS